MKLISPQKPPVFNLLSIGQRGVGKTVFLAGSYAQLSAQRSQGGNSSVWFECLNHRDRENLEGILGHVAQNGHYPPATLKITDFNFSLKQKTWQGEKTLCHFRWWDIPGETCDFHHPDFQKLTLTSHGCCVFINAARLIGEPEYARELEAIVKQVISIAALVSQTESDYPFALIFTQCDRLDDGPIGQLQIEEHLPLLITSLETADAKFRRFYAAIPIVQEQGNFRFNPTGAIEPFLWIATQLRQQPVQQDLETTLAQNTNTVPLLASQRNRPTIFLISAIVGLLGLAGIALLALTFLNPSPQSAQSTDPQVQQYLKTLRTSPQDFETLVALSNRYIELGELVKAIPLIEKIVQQKPQDLEWQLNLARLYELTEKSDEAEQVYDRILAQNSSYLQALLGKAMLRQKQGDKQTAKQLFKKAEQVAPQNLKARIRSMAETSQ